MNIQQARDKGIGQIITNRILSGIIREEIPSQIPEIMQELSKLDDSFLWYEMVKSRVEYMDYLETKAIMDRCYYTEKDKIF